MTRKMEQMQDKTFLRETIISGQLPSGVDAGRFVRALMQNLGSPDPDL